MKHCDATLDDEYALHMEAIHARTDCEHRDLVMLRQDRVRDWTDGTTEKVDGYRAGETWHQRLICQQCKKVLLEQFVSLHGPATSESMVFLERAGSLLFKAIGRETAA